MNNNEIKGNMKTFFTGRNILVWAVVLLLIMNISVIATIFYKRHEQTRILIKPPAAVIAQQMRPGLYLRNELDLSEEQFEAFNKVRMKYQLAVRDINIEINSRRKIYMDELMKANPDTEMLKTASDSIGKLHARIINETGNYYNEIKSICNEKQMKNLNTFFLRVMQTDIRPGMQMQRNMPRQQFQRNRRMMNESDRNYK